MYIAAFNPPAKTTSVTIITLHFYRLTKVSNPKENLVNPTIVNIYHI